MRTVLFAVVVIALLFLADAETLGKAKIRVKAKTLSPRDLFQSMKKSSFGTTLLNMIALKSKTSDGELEAILALIQDLDERIDEQQQEDQAAFREQNQALQDLIDGREEVISQAQQKVADLTAEIGDARLTIAQQDVLLLAAQEEDDQLAAYEALLVQIRTSDADRYQRRVDGQQELIAGLLQTINLFESQQANQDLPQAVISQLLDLLRNLQTAYESSITDDAASENTAKTTYATDVANLDARQAELGQAVTELEAGIAEGQERVEQSQANLDAAAVRLDNASQLLAQYQQQQTKLIADYNNNTDFRTQQRNLIALLIQILTQNPDAVQDILSDSEVD